MIEDRILRGCIQSGDYARVLELLRPYVVGLLAAEDAGRQSPGLVEDALGDVFEALLQSHQAGYLATIRSLKSWCATVAIRSHRRRLADRPREARLLGNPPDPQTPGQAEGHLLDAELRAQVLRAIGSMPPAMAEIMQLSLREDLTPTQIADALRRAGRTRSLPSIKNTLTQGRRILRKALKRHVLREERP